MKIIYVEKWFTFARPPSSSHTSHTPYSMLHTLWYHLVFGWNGMDWTELVLTLTPDPCYFEPWKFVCVHCTLYTDIKYLQKIKDWFVFGPRNNDDSDDPDEFRIQLVSSLFPFHRVSFIHPLSLSSSFILEFGSDGEKTWTLDTSHRRSSSSHWFVFVWICSLTIYDFRFMGCDVVSSHVTFWYFGILVYLFCFRALFLTTLIQMISQLTCSVLHPAMYYILYFTAHDTHLLCDVYLFSTYFLFSNLKAQNRIQISLINTHTNHNICSL